MEKLISVNEISEQSLISLNTNSVDNNTTFSPSFR